ncbi:iron chelate uptake ABC transporter family permease subunit [Streptomyces sp. SID8366]|uniref:FecCD family ABC transporter permease n=1 Tax=unclassified Streptomyces TaxID=2593676 RepID=UPI000DBAA2B0|nr:iron chelate uptake ABC transporter family permease subunit [Streptomyces sp. PsTaAH-130]MYU02646.1 iron chelate uptake ABC transporter family permease subunit [Streptomyces sp. SID8366]MYU62869.1 iron chelate uptake ABC transporter family permease subunit [Streptomyces sp. SID69]RAJ55548.1 iron complex transport system permease protein [Streptomyces sp. PsTaAH-130]
MTTRTSACPARRDPVLLGEVRHGTVLRGRVLRLNGGRISLRWQPRTVVVCLLLAAACLTTGVIGLTTGTYRVPLPDVLACLLGHGSGAESFIVVGLRLPRLVCALLAGGALGMSGAVFQSMSRNPLGSPDVIGFTSGAASGAVVQIVLFHGGPYATAVASIGGGLATALLVGLVAAGRGPAVGHRIVLIGIGVSAMLTSLTAYLLTRASLYEAQDAQIWLIGSLNSASWSVVTPLAAALAVLVPVTVVASRALHWLELGEDTARGLGVPVGRARILLAVAATALAAATTAAVGPITFVALAAPHLCRRLVRSPGAPVVPAGFMGALLLTASDFAAQRVLPGTELPVGALTGVLGGLYLCRVLVTRRRAGRA